MKKVSIVVPCYNVENFLEDCFKSIKAQTFSDFEVIFVNDGSKDNSLKKIQKFCQENENVKYVDQENMGLSEARNSGLAIAEGEFVYFLDSDDMIDPNFLKNMVEAIAEHDVAICKYRFVPENFHNFGKGQNAKGKEVIQDNHTVMEEYLSTRLQPNVCNKLYRHEILKKLPTYPKVFDSHYKWGEDYPFNFTYFRLCNSAVFLKSKLYFYRRRKGSLVRSKFNKKMLGIFDAHEVILKACKEKYEDLIPYVKAFQCVSCVEMLFRMRRAKYGDKEKIQELRKLLKNSKKSFRKAKRVQWYKKLIPLASWMF